MGDVPNPLEFVIKAYNAISTGFTVQLSDRKMLRQLLIHSRSAIEEIQRDKCSTKKVIFTGLNKHSPGKAYGLGEIFEIMAMVAGHIEDHELSIEYGKEFLAYELNGGDPIGVITALHNLTVSYFAHGNCPMAGTTLVKAEQYLKEHDNRFPSGLGKIRELRETYERQCMK